MKKKLLIFIESLIPALLPWGCTRQPMNGSMGGWDHMMGYGGYGGMYMWLILIIIAGIIVYFAYQRNKRPENPRESARENPVEILKKRYAKGEITKEEFERIKKEIER